MNLKLCSVMLCLSAGMMVGGGVARAAADPAANPDVILEVVRIHPEGVHEPAIYHVFGGQAVELDLALTPRGQAAEPVTIRADIFQKARSLLAPLQKDLPVSDQVPAPAIGSTAPMWQWKLPVPEVKRETEMLVRFHAKGAGPEWRPAGQVLLKVYPKDFIKDDLSQIAGERRIHVFGDDKRLRDFLRGQKIEFDDDGPDLPALSDPQQSKALYLGSAPSAQMSRWVADHSDARANLVVFCRDSDLLPGVYSVTQGGIRMAKVTLAVLDTLAFDPRSQKTLVEILRLIQPDAKPGTN